MKKFLQKKLLLYAKRIFILWLIYVVVCVIIPPLFHQSVIDETSFSHVFSGRTAEERVRSIDNNMDALLWRLRLIEAAQERLVLATFDFRDDNSGRDMMAALFQAAERGVEVQILVDGINGMLWLTGSENFRELAAHEYVEVKLYNPISLLKPWVNNYRMHDKYLIADDFAYILGGRNTDDLFLGDYVDSYNEDRDILVYETVPGEGSSYVRLWEYFEQVWNLPCCRTYEKRWDGTKNLGAHYQEVREKYPDAFEGQDWEMDTMEIGGIKLYTNPTEPGNKQPQLWGRLVEEMKRRDDILIQTPYIICSREMYQDLSEISEDAKVEVITNAVEGGSNPFGCTDYLNQKKRIRQTGIDTYEYLGEQALHTKTILAGDDISIVGSCNLDMRSIYLDTEMMLVIESPELNESLRRQIEELKEVSRKVSPDGTIEDGERYQPVEQGIGKRALYGVLRVIIIPIRHLL